MTATRPTRRTQVARLRADRAKARILVATVVVFIVAMLLARLSYAGHTKRGASSLAPPKRFVDIVKHNRLASGIIAPAAAPPEVASAPS